MLRLCCKPFKLLVQPFKTKERDITWKNLLWISCFQAFVTIIDSSISTYRDPKVPNYDSNEVRGPPRSGGSEGDKNPEGV